MEGPAPTEGAPPLQPAAPDEPVADVFMRAPCRASTPGESQGEAVGFAADGGSYWSISEGSNQPIWRMEIAR